MIAINRLELLSGRGVHVGSVIEGFVQGFFLAFWMIDFDFDFDGVPRTDGSVG